MCLLLLSAGLGGCRSYEAAPLDPAAHRAAFLQRTGAEPSVAAFAKALREREASPLVFDPTDGFGLGEGEAVALVLNADLRVARLKAGVTRAGADNAGLWEDPMLGVDLARIVQSTPNPWILASSIGLTLPISGRLDAEKQRAGSEHAADLARVAELEWRTRMELRRAWARLVASNLRVATIRAYLAQVDQVLGVVDAMERAHELTRTEARLFRVEQAGASAELVQGESQRDLAALEVKRLLGVAPQGDVVLHAASFGDCEPAQRGERESVEVLGERLSSPDSTSPEMQVALAEYQVAERALALEVRKQYPDLQLGPGYGREDGQDQVLFGISVPLPLLNANRRGIAEAFAARDVARAEAERVQERMLWEVARAEVEWRGAEANRRRLEEQIVPMVDAQYADAQAVARLGEVNTLVLLDSLKRQYDVKVRLIDARRDEVEAGIRFDEIAGPCPGKRVTGPQGASNAGPSRGETTP